MKVLTVWITDIPSVLSPPHPPSVYQEKQIHPAQVGPSFLSPSFQKADRWKTWCFSSYWTCGENLGCCWSCCHLPRDWEGHREPLRGGSRTRIKSLYLINLILMLYLRNSRGSSSIAPGWVRVILSNRGTRGVEGGVESRRARDRSSSLLFWNMYKEPWKNISNSLQLGWYVQLRSHFSCRTAESLRSGLLEIIFYCC